jgi:hypothetical protein
MIYQHPLIVEYMAVDFGEPCRHPVVGSNQAMLITAVGSERAAVGRVSVVVVISCLRSLPLSCLSTVLVAAQGPGGFASFVDNGAGRP